MRLCSPAKCLNFILSILTAFFLFFLILCILPFADPWFEQDANAAIQENRPFSQTDQADLDQSEMMCPTGKVRERDSITYEIILRNTGIQTSENVGLWFDVRTTAAMLGSASPELSFSQEERMLHWRGTIGPREERSFVVKLITLPKSAGSTIINPVSAIWGETKKYFHCETEVLSRETKSKILFMAGRVEIGWLEITIIGYFLFVPLFLIVVPCLIRWRKRQHFESSPDVSWRDSDPKQIMVYAISIAFLACVAVMLFFAAFVFEDIRKFSSYEKTACTILDKKIEWSTGSTGKTKSRIYDPLVSVRYEVNGKEIVSAGSIVKGTFSGREGSAEKKLAQYELGSSYPCWFDPEDPQEFLLERGLYWGWYLLCIGPMILFLISSRYLLKKLRKAAAPDETSKDPIHPG